MTTALAVLSGSADRWDWRATVLSGTPGTWDSRGARVTAVVPGVGVAYDGRASKEENFAERTGLAVPVAGGKLSAVGDGPVADVRYLDVVALPRRRYRLFYEAPLPDGSHELSSEEHPATAVDRLHGSGHGSVGVRGPGPHRPNAGGPFRLILGRDLLIQSAGPSDRTPVGAQGVSGHNRRGGIAVVQSVELLLDAVGDAAVREDWERLRSAGLPSQGRIAASSNRPHITVAVAAQLATDAEDAMTAAATRLAFRLPIELVMGGLLLFPGRRTVLARSVVPATDLLAVHAEFAAALGDFAQVPDTMAPGRWTPHITLARGVLEAELPAAVDVVRHDPVDTSAMAIRRWDGSARREWIIAEAARAEGSTRGSIP